MFPSMNKTLAAISALAIALPLAAAPAQAKPPKFEGPVKFIPKPIGKPGGWKHHGHGYGYGAPLAAGLIGGLALGALGAAAYEPACYVEEREALDRYGNVYIRPVRVCD